MDPVRSFFTSLTSDIVAATKADGRGEPQDLKNTRITSIASRVLGALCYTGSAAVLLSALANPPLAIINVVMAVALFVIGHDLVKIGSNLSDRVKLVDSPPEGWTDLFNRGWNLGGMIYGEVSQGVPQGLHGTWVAADIYRAFNP